MSASAKVSSLTSVPFSLWPYRRNRAANRSDRDYLIEYAKDSGRFESIALLRMDSKHGRFPQRLKHIDA